MSENRDIIGTFATTRTQVNRARTTEQRNIVREAGVGLIDRATARIEDRIRDFARGNISLTSVLRGLGQWTVEVSAGAALIASVSGNEGEDDG